MKKGSLTIIGVLLAVGIVVNVWQGGTANLLTWLGYTPLLVYLLILALSWAVIAWRNRPRSLNDKAK